MRLLESGGGSLVCARPSGAAIHARGCGRAPLLCVPGWPCDSQGGDKQHGPNEPHSNSPCRNTWTVT
eukprot:6640958-Alexandrium_andersonii.AAC.1